MLEVVQRTDEDEEAAGGRLAPLPKRVDEDLTGQPPLEVVAQLLERTAALLKTLVHDEAGLAEDEEEERLRIDRERTQLRAEAQQALERLADLGRQAEEIAAKKGKSEVLQQGLARAKRPEGKVDYRATLTDLLDELKAAHGITGAMRLPRIGELMVHLGVAVEQMVDEAEHYTERRLSEARQEKDAETKEARASFDIGLMVLNRDLVALDAGLPATARPWGSPAWATWQPAGDDVADTVVRFGAYVDPQLDAEIPLLWAFPPERGLYLETGQHRDAALGCVQSLALRLLAALPPGALRIGVIDPKGLGESAAPLMGLAEFGDAVLIGGVATTPEDIEALLADTTRHIERVIQYYLRGRFASLAEANAEAGEVLEPYRLLCIFDHPSGLSEQATAQLAAIAANGPRCGVFPVIAKDSQPAGAFAGAWGAPKLEGLDVWRSDANGFFVESREAGRWSVRFDRPPTSRRADDPVGPAPAEAVPELDTGVDTGVDTGPRVPVGPVDPDLLERVTSTVGGGALARRDRSVALHRLFALHGRSREIRSRGLAPIDPESTGTWWTRSSAEDVTIPLGRAGADISSVVLDAGTPGLLAVGRTGSGISNAVTALVLGAALSYDPSELDLRLLSLGPAPELLRLAEHDLPHLSLVATDADLELVTSVLGELEHELEHRYELLRASVGERAGWGAYRAETGERRPRIVCLLDRFGPVLGTRSRSFDATATIERLLRMGGPVGIHLVLVTTPTDRAALGAEVIGGIRQRLLFQMDEATANDLAGDAAAEVLASALPGDAVVLDGRDDPHPTRLRTVLVEPLELELCLRDARRLADERGIDVRPRIIAGDRPARIEQHDLQELIGDPAQRAARRMPRFLLGEPTAVGHPVEAQLRRTEGGNLLAVTADDELGQGLLVAAITSAAFVHGPHLATMTVDFMPMESGFTEAMQILGTGPWTIQVARRRSLGQVLEVIHRVVEDRRSSGDHKGKTVLFVLNGLGRARELEVDAEGRPSGEHRDLLDTLAAILRDGPDVGVHTIVWTDSVASLHRRLPSSCLRDFALRIAGPMRAEDGVELVDTDATAQLRPNQAVLYDDDAGRIQRFVPYASPPRDWLHKAVAAAGE